jgi:hypothetical protein
VTAIATSTGGGGGSPKKAVGPLGLRSECELAGAVESVQAYAKTRANSGRSGKRFIGKTLIRGEPASDAGRV